MHPKACDRLTHRTSHKWCFSDIEQRLQIHTRTLIEDVPYTVWHNMCGVVDVDHLVALDEYPFERNLDGIDSIEHHLNTTAIDMVLFRCLNVFVLLIIELFIYI